MSALTAFARPFGNVIVLRGLPVFVSEWTESAVKAEQSLYKDVLKLAGVDPVKVAKCAIDEAKRKAVEAKKTPKPPIAAKTLRAPK
jgi:hypothetical protein